MRLSKTLSIRQKMVAITMLITAVALLLTCTAFIIYDLTTHRSEMVMELRTLTRVIGNNLTAAIAFDDATAAKEILSALKATTHILAASLYLPDGKPMATYFRNNIAAPIPPLEQDGYRFSKTSLTSFQSILLNDETIGSLYLESDLEAPKTRLRRSVLIVAMIIPAVSAILFLIASRLQKLISAPILHLAQATERVSQEKDYSLRVEKQSEDEVGALIDGFNRMLTQIQSRDSQLLEAQNELERRVDERTKELRKTNTELDSMLQRLKDSEQQLKAANQELRDQQDQLRESTLQLVQAEKLSGIGEIAAGVAHELSQPLNATKIICQSVIRDIQKNRFDIEEAKRDLPDIVSQMDRMARIIDHMRLFARRTEGGVAEVGDLNAIVEGTFTFLRQQLRNQDVEILTDYTPDLPKVKADPIRLEQVFMNLITNARHAMEGAGKESKILSIKTYTDGERGCVIAEIRDNGAGIAEEMRERIFESFFTTKEAGRGTGLGLSMVRRIVQEHNGTIEMESEVGVGTTFYVVLPIYDGS